MDNSKTVKVGDIFQDEEEIGNDGIFVITRLTEFDFDARILTGDEAGEELFMELDYLDSCKRLAKVPK